MTDDSTGVLDRVTVIFQTLAEDAGGMGITELASRAGLPKSTVSRLVSGLVDGHYLERDGATIRLGLRLFELGQLAESPHALRRSALPIMTALRNSTGGSVELAIRDDNDMVRVAVARARSDQLTMGRIGERTPVHSSPLGRAAVAQTRLTEIVRNALGPDGMPRGVAVLVSPLTSTTHGLEAVIAVTVPASGADLGQIGAALESAARAIERRLRDAGSVT